MLYEKNVFFCFTNYIQIIYEKPILKLPKEQIHSVIMFLIFKMFFWLNFLNIYRNLLFTGISIFIRVEDQARIKLDHHWNHTKTVAVGW